MESPPPESLNANHQKIADAVGVSRSTVSRALQNSPSISEATRARVKEAAERLGYRPNPLVSALMERIRHRRSDSFQGKIAVLTDREDGVNWYKSNTQWHRLFEGARQRAVELGFELENFCTREFDDQGRRLSQILTTRGIPGILIAPGSLKGRINLEWQNFSVASVCFSLRHPRFHRVFHDNFNAIQVAMRRLSELGYRRPGLILRTRHDEITNGHYRAGFLLAQNDLVEPRNRIPVQVVPRLPAAEFLAWLDRTRPDVVLTYRGEKNAQWAQEAGWRIPQDLGFVHLNHTPEAPFFAGIDHNAAHLGRAAIDLIIAQIQRSETGIPAVPADLSFEGRWVDGPSIAPQTDKRPKEQSPGARGRAPRRKLKV